MEKLTLASLSAQNQAAAIKALQQSSRLGPEAKITSHLVLKAFDRERRNIDILHKDLFDSSTEVVLSALAALGVIGDQRSLKHVARLLTQPDDALQCAAVRAIGEIGHPGVIKILMDLFKVSNSETLRCAILEALADLDHRDAEVRHLIQECYASRLLSPKIRAVAARLLLELEIEEVDISDLLAGAKEPVIEMILSWATANQQMRAQTLKYGASHYGLLSPANRGRIAALASPYSTREALSILREALSDPDSSVRQCTYRRLGDSPDQREAFAFIVSQLGNEADPDLAVEEEALAAIQRLEAIPSEGDLSGADVRKMIYTHIEEEFSVLSTSDRQVGSDNHELGWLISRSKEYLQYYADEDFRQALLHFLKGGGYYTQERILAELKATAVKVEVRHFDGYRALVDIIKNPKRAGIGLITRELAIVKLGKRMSLLRLVRNLRLSRLLPNASGNAQSAELFFRILSWAMKARLYRLAEAALFALAKADPRQAAEACLECLRPPVFSKICAIAAIRLIHELDWGKIEPAIITLLSSTDDPHLLLNLVEGLERSPNAQHGDITSGLLRVLNTGTHQEVMRRVADFLSTHSSFALIERIAEMYANTGPTSQEMLLIILERKIRENTVINRDGVVELLYRILRDEGGCHRAKAAMLLWRLDDDYAPRLLAEFLDSGDAAQICTILHGLGGALRASILPRLGPALRSEHTSVHRALREALVTAAEEETRTAVLELVLAVRCEGGVECEEPGAHGEEELRIDFFKEKKAFRFEKEHLQELAILFTDIQGYSKKAQSLSTLQLTTLIQDYEGILLPTLTGHRGELIKRMGDGHLWVFGAAVDAALAAIRLQKALKRFNSYREESQRILIRIGIHWGKVVRKEGDVLGNHVNIASRLERSAAVGSILVSEALYQHIGQHVHARDLGLIEVKGISAPIRVFEPYEISIEFPHELDPWQKARPVPGQRRGLSAEGLVGEVPRNGSGKAKMFPVDSTTLSFISASFTSLNRLCLEAETKQIAVEEIRKELVRRWLKLKSLLPKRGVP